MPDVFDADPSELDDVEESEDLDENDESDDENSDVLYLKYMFEGAATIAELSDELRRLSQELDRQAGEGWRLGAPVDGGYAHLVREEA